MRRNRLFLTPITRLRPLCLSALLAVGALLIPVARADVQDTLRFTPYRVEVQAGETLVQALNRATPVRRWWGKRFHGLATWSLRWAFRWQVLEDGRCGVAEVLTTLDTDITLPELVTDDPILRARFDTYLAALREHELGHHEIARQAAQRVDQGLRELPPQNDCRQLEVRGNHWGQAQLDRAREQEQAYDRDTRYGRTQGAWLGAD